MKGFQSLFRTLKEIYPPYLLLLIAIPIVAGFIIDYELAESRNIIINLIWIPIFTIPYILFQKKAIYKAAITIFFLFGFIELGHWIILRGPLTVTSLFVMSNTNFQETIEFFDLKATIWLILLLPYIYLYYVSFRNSSKIDLAGNKIYIISTVLLISLIFISENAIRGRLSRKGVPHIAKVTLSFIDKKNLYKEAMQNISPKNIQAESALSNCSQTFVLILGESCNRKHMSIYGATRKTNPKLEYRNDIIVFDNVVSPYSNTLNSILTILSQSNLEQTIDFEKSIDVFDVFHSAGFKTYWISNQSPIGIWDNLVTVFAKKADYFKFVNTTSNSSFEAILSTSYDSKLFSPFSEVLGENVKNKFIVLHLMGSHASYSKRYPKNFKVFNADNTKDKTIAEYDNSMLYNDFIIDSLLNILISNSDTAQNHIASAIYLSDHGENVYDELNRIGHDFSNQLPKANVEIPFLVWLSDTYIKNNPELAASLRANVKKPYVSDDLFHSIMNLNKIQSPYFEEERSLFSNKFDETRPRILEDGHDFDK